MILNRDIFTDFVIVLNASACLISLLTSEIILALMFGLNACIMFQYRVNKEKQ